MIKKIVNVSPVSAPVSEVAVEALLAEVAPVVEGSSPVDVLRGLVAQRKADLDAANATLASGFTPEGLELVRGAYQQFRLAEEVLAKQIAEINAATFIPEFVTHLGAVAKNVPHAVWGATVRFEVTFTAEGVPSVRRIAQPATYSPSGAKTVTRNRSASVGRDQRLPSQGWWFASQRIVIRISDDSDQVVAWTLGGHPQMFGSISSACTKLLGVSTNGYAYTNLGSTEDAWSDSQPRKGWSCGEMPQHLKPASF
jgi:hypothetical protein